MSTPLKFIRRINRNKVADPVANILGLLIALLFLHGRFNHTFYFYRQNKAQLFPSALLGLLLLGLMVWNRKDPKLWKDWLKAPGIAIGLATLILLPIGVWVFQWSCTFQPKETTAGAIVEKRAFGIRRRFFLYSGLLIGVRTSDGKTQQFDFACNHKDDYDRARVGQLITIQHHPQIKDEFLDVQLE